MGISPYSVSRPVPEPMPAFADVLRDMRERRAQAILKTAKATEPARTASDTLRREQALLRPGSWRAPSDPPAA